MNHKKITTRNGRCLLFFKKREVVDSQAAFIHGSRSLPADLSWPLKLALAYQDVIMTYRYKHQKKGENLWLYAAN